MNEIAWATSVMETSRAGGILLPRQLRAERLRAVQRVSDPRNPAAVSTTIDIYQRGYWGVCTYDLALSKLARLVQQLIGHGCWGVSS